MSYEYKGYTIVISSYGVCAYSSKGLAFVCATTAEAEEMIG